MAEEYTPNEVVLDTKTENELSDEDKAFAKRFNLKPEDFQFKRLAELELENN